MDYFSFGLGLLIGMCLCVLIFIIYLKIRTKNLEIYGSASIWIRDGRKIVNVTKEILDSVCAHMDYMATHSHGKFAYHKPNGILEWRRNK
jgi:hypothetical protein